LERLRILRDNIYGVDLDPQAVEIARLNLLLKTLHRRALLPKLEDNIRCGNSLISGLPIELSQYFGADWEAKRPFNWEEQFPKIMEEGGFDVVMGNPPYVRIQALDRDEVGYYKDEYQAATGNYDIYTLFVERGWELLKPGGVFGMILSNKFMQASYGKGLRKFLAEARAVSQVVDFGDAQVFEAGTTYTCLLFLRKKPNQEVFVIPAEEYLEGHVDSPNLTDAEALGFSVETSALSDGPWLFNPPVKQQLMDKIATVGIPLGNVAVRIFQGLKTSADAIYVLSEVKRTENQITVKSKADGKRYDLEPDLLKPLIKGGEMRRYIIEEPNRLLLFPYIGAQLVTPSLLRKRFPRTWKYLRAHKTALEEREGGRMKGKDWYAYIYPKNLDQFDLLKITTPDVASRASYGYDSEGKYYFTGGAAGGYGIVPKEGVVPQYVLGLLNSRLLDWYLHQISSRFRSGYYSYEARFIRQLPIRRIDFDDPQDVKMHDDLVAMVERMLDLHKRLKDAKGEEERNLERQIARTDGQIDKLVYELYGITEEERKIIDEKTSP